MSKNNTLISNIQNKIHTIRNMQVMLDRDIALLYAVETKVLNQAVKRNIERFPAEFRFQLSKAEFEHVLSSQFVNLGDKSLRSQFVTLENKRGKHRKYLPYAFTEQGVAMISAVLKSKPAISASVQIMQAFVNMRKFITNNAQVFSRLDNLEQKQHKTDSQINTILDAIEQKDSKPKQGIFFDGEIFDAYVFVSGLVKSAKKSILLNNYKIG